MWAIVTDDGGRVVRLFSSEEAAKDGLSEVIEEMPKWARLSDEDLEEGEEYDLKIVPLTEDLLEDINMMIWDDGEVFNY